MKKAWTIIGILILVIGIFTISTSNAQKEETDQTFVQVEDEWSISDTFQKGETMGLLYYQAADWSRYVLPHPEFGDPGDPPYLKIFMVNITNINAKNYTLIEVDLVPPPGNSPPQHPFTFTLRTWDIKVTHHGAIMIEDAPTEIKGIAKEDGLYLVECSLIPLVVRDDDLDPPYRPASPPPQLRLYKTTIEYPYEFLLPIGASLSVVGVVTSIWGFRSKKRKVTRRKSKR